MVVSSAAAMKKELEKMMLSLLCPVMVKPITNPLLWAEALSC